jgi:hypothetical protein
MHPYSVLASQSHNHAEPRDLGAHTVKRCVATAWNVASEVDTNGEDISWRAGKVIGEAAVTMFISAFVTRAIALTTIPLCTFE